jgi:cell division protein FtsL
MTRGRAWIAVLGVLLVGIVALNVATLSFAASSGKIDAQITALEKENTMLESREAERFSTARVRSAAGELGLAMPNTEEPRVIEAGPADVAAAAQRLAAAGG